VNNMTSLLQFSEPSFLFSFVHALRLSRLWIDVPKRRGPLLSEAGVVFTLGSFCWHPADVSVSKPVEQITQCSER
jgi:hypothetical protein